VSASPARRGALLIVVAGLCALLAAMSFAFLIRMRADGEDGQRLAQDIQARVMLSAALMYVQETSRLGWKGETFGWVDVRDGMPGPRGFDGEWPPKLAGLMEDDGTASTSPGVFPAIGGRAARNPMYAMRRPPYAVKPTIAPNPVPVTDLATAALPWDKLINYAVRDPQPAESDWDDFRLGDTEPLPASGIPSWFRVYRAGVTRFIITCGAGASQGYRDWAEVQADGAEAAFGSEREFNAIRGFETRLWYETQWTDVVTGNNFLYGHYGRFNQRAWGPVDVNAAETPNMRQFAGTFTYIQRRFDEPDEW